jgi:hypothetical protein
MWKEQGCWSFKGGNIESKKQSMYFTRLSNYLYNRTIKEDFENIFFKESKVHFSIIFFSLFVHQ